MTVFAALTLASLSAHAGGVGVFGTAGAHTETHYYYSNAIFADDQVVLLDDPDDYEQFELHEFLPSAGGGVELVLGDRDKPINGSFRFWAWADLPVTPAVEANAQVPTENIVEAPRLKARAIGMGMVGLNFGLVGEPDATLFGFTAHVGSGFLTNDHTEFLCADIGPQISYAVNESYRLSADVVYTVREHKGYSHGVNTFVTARYYFD